MFPLLSRRSLSTIAAGALMAAAAGTGIGFENRALATPSVGQPAPAFTGVDTAGTTHSLADFMGKTVVLEWTNHDCPYVMKHYGSGNMQALQKRAEADGAVWLTVISSAPGKQGHVSPEQADRIAAERGAGPTAILLDPEGAIGRAYDARTTPHMYVIDGDGTLVYRGGIDDRPTADRADVEGANNYVTAALADLSAGRDVQTPTSRPYGCSVKY
jgi:peroxiredoxin